MNRAQIKALSAHPGFNPAYLKGMERRQTVQHMNRDLPKWSKLRTPKQPNKYVPHYGAKQAAKYATKATTAGRMGGAA